MAKNFLGFDLEDPETRKKALIIAGAVGGGIGLLYLFTRPKGIEVKPVDQATGTLAEDEQSIWDEINQFMAEIGSNMDKLAGDLYAYVDESNAQTQEALSAMASDFSAALESLYWAGAGAYGYEDYGDAGWYGSGPYEDMTTSDAKKKLSPLEEHLAQPGSPMAEAIKKMRTSLVEGQGKPPTTSGIEQFMSGLTGVKPPKPKPEVGQTLKPPAQLSTRPGILGALQTMARRIAGITSGLPAPIVPPTSPPTPYRSSIASMFGGTSGVSLRKPPAAPVAPKPAGIAGISARIAAGVRAAVPRAGAPVKPPAPKPPAPPPYQPPAPYKPPHLPPEPYRPPARPEPGKPRPPKPPPAPPPAPKPRGPGGAVPNPY